MTYIKNLKNSFQIGEIIVVGDFSENYKFVVQDSIQSFYFGTSQCTIHPFVVYFPSKDEVQHQSYCFISDNLKHDSAMIYTFICHLIAELKSKHQCLNKVHYFSNGCSAQY